LAALSEGDKALIRQAASLTLQCETMQGAIARGEAIDTDALIRLSSEVRRALKGIRNREPVKTKTLADHFAAKRGAAA
jgi:hypothetical protein